TDARGVYVPAEEVVEEPDGRYIWRGQQVRREYGKMGKSLRNSVSPDEMSDTYGADTLRVYEMSMGPLDVSRPWATKDVVGAYRFLQRLWRNLVDENTGELRVVDAELNPDVQPDLDTLRALHRAIDGVRQNYAALRLNTAIAKLIELNNHITKTYGASLGTPRAVAEPLVLLLAPVAPHVAEELWSRLGHDQSLAHGPMPQAQQRYLVEDTVEYPIQINGKVRSRVVVPASASPDEVRAAALAHARIATLIDDAEPRKVIVVPGRLVNLVV
ncbi:MAG: class I tRNA ligase family protein, partial [Pseudonocardiales bacterium]|nr:class I tRNA ligase family protein [Pseudonocardiales bacterium]